MNSRATIIALRHFLPLVVPVPRPRGLRLLGGIGRRSDLGAVGPVGEQLALQFAGRIAGSIVERPAGEASFARRFDGSGSGHISGGDRLPGRTLSGGRALRQQLPGQSRAAAAVLPGAVASRLGRRATALAVGAARLPPEARWSKGGRSFGSPQTMRGRSAAALVAGLVANVRWDGGNETSAVAVGGGSGPRAGFMVSRSAAAGDRPGAALRMGLVGRSTAGLPGPAERGLPPQALVPARGLAVGGRRPEISEVGGGLGSTRRVGGVSGVSPGYSQPGSLAAWSARLAPGRGAVLPSGIRAGSSLTISTVRDLEKLRGLGRGRVGGTFLRPAALRDFDRNVGAERVVFGKRGTGPGVRSEVAVGFSLEDLARAGVLSGR